MKRPDFVTDEDLARWSDNVDNDPHLPDSLKENPIFRELGYAGLWLDEELAKLGCPSSLRVRITYTAAKSSYGRDIWAVHQLYLTSFEKNELQFEEDDPASHTIQS